MKRLLLCAIVLCSAVSIPYRVQAEGLAFQRAAHLQRGINLSMWYAQAGDYSAQRLTTYTTPDDFKLVKSLGFDHARLSINPEPLMLNGKPDAFDPAQVYFEVLNEPHMDDSFRWAGIQSRAVATIRAVAPMHTIIATGNHWGGVEGLLELEPVRDANVIYSFHDYDPMTFTHQGATWAGEFLKPLHGVPYPSSPENVASLMGLESEDGGKKQLAWYGTEHWDAAHVDKEIASMGAWGAQHKVPIWCGEFGVYQTFSEPEARAAWLHDMRMAFEAHHIGWSMWDYQGGFALVSKENGKTTVDNSVAGALGLKTAGQE